MANVRKMVVSALCRVEQDSAYSNILLNDFFKKYTVTQKDKALATILFYGVLDRKITIDYWLNKLSKVKVKKMDPITLQALRIGIYQLAFLDKIPVSAAVNESVNIVKKSAENRNSGFVNAVLRSASRELPHLPKANTPENISVVCSCPIEIVNQLVRDYSVETAYKILNSFLDPADVFVKVNSVLISDNDFEKRLNDLGVEYEKCDSYSFKLLKYEDLFESELYNEGLFYVQDPASQKCAIAVGAIEGQRVLDVCAAPGGKSFSIAQQMNNCGELVSCDIYEKRVELIRKGASRLKLDCIKAVCNDATVYNKDLGEFDCVLCDVPCSGWGVMRRKPEIKYKDIFSFEDLEFTQSKILNTSSSYVKKGGRLIYSTCTLRKSENEAIVNNFLKQNSQFSLCQMETILPSECIDGFFFAVMIKN